MPETNSTSIDSIPSTIQQIQAAAAQRSYELAPSRLDNLTALAETHSKFPADSRLVFDENGLMIKRPMRMGVSGFKPGLMSQLDFIPIVDKDSEIVANPHPQRGSTTAITLMGIEAFQDFVLLADAGIVPKPEKFFGTTNPTMANFARRVGFEQTPRLSDGVIADYDVVAERVFSPDMIEIQQKLSERQAAKAAGQLAMNS